MPHPPPAEARWANGLRGREHERHERRQHNDFTALRPLLRSYSVQQQRHSTHRDPTAHLHLHHTKSPSPSPIPRKRVRSRTQAAHVVPRQAPRQTRPHAQPAQTHARYQVPPTSLEKERERERDRERDRAERGRPAERMVQPLSPLSLATPPMLSAVTPVETTPVDSLSIEQLWVAVAARDGRMRIANTDTQMCSGCAANVLSHWCTPQWVPKTRHRATYRKELAHLQEKARTLLMEERGRRPSRSVSPSSRYSPTSSATYDDSTTEQMYAIVQRQAEMIEALSHEVGAVQEHTATLRAAADNYHSMHDVAVRRADALQRDLERERRPTRMFEVSPARTGSPDADDHRSPLRSIPPGTKLSEHALHLERVASTVPVDFGALTKGFESLREEAVHTEQRLEDTLRELASFEEMKLELSKLSAIRADTDLHDTTHEEDTQPPKHSRPEPSTSPTSPPINHFPPPEATLIPNHAVLSYPPQDIHRHKLSAIRPPREETPVRARREEIPLRAREDAPLRPREEMLRPREEAPARPREEPPPRARDEVPLPLRREEELPTHATHTTLPQEAVSPTTQTTSSTVSSIDHSMLLRVDWVYELLDSKCRELRQTHEAVLQRVTHDSDGSDEAGLLLDQLEVLPDGSVAREEWQSWFSVLSEIGQSPDPILEFLLSRLRGLPRGGEGGGGGGRGGGMYTDGDVDVPQTPPREVCV